MLGIATALRFRPFTGLHNQLFSISSQFLQASVNVSVSEDGTKLKLLCDGEQERRYHGVWLRHNCRCPECFPAYSHQNIVHHSHLEDLKLTNAKVKGDNVRVEWKSATGNHSCEFGVDWLKDYDYTTPGIHDKRRKEETPLITESLPISDYHEVVSSNEEYYEWMKQINFYGMSLLKNIPVVDKQMVKLCQRIAEPQPHAYDVIFDIITEVDDKDDAIDAALTNNELLLHLDECYMESPPGIQVLFCLKFDDCIEGGESILVDSYPVIEEFRKKHQKQFEVLTRVPCIVQREHESLKLSDFDFPVSFKYSSPHIVLDAYDRLCGFNWSPQNHSPLQVKEEHVEEYYEAFVLLSKMLEESPLKILHRLRPGEAIAFNNRRVLHSRNRFKTNGGTRHLQGLYLNIDFFRSKFQVLAKQLNKEDPVKHLFNHSCVA